MPPPDRSESAQRHRKRAPTVPGHALRWALAAPARRRLLEYNRWVLRLERWLPFLRDEYPPQTLTCPMCGQTGPYSGSKAWELAGTDGGLELRRCQRCGAEVSVKHPWQWWVPSEVRLYSPTALPAKGKRRRLERRARAGARAAGGLTPDPHSCRAAGSSMKSQKDSGTTKLNSCPRRLRAPGAP